MNNINILNRLKNIIPKNITPKFKNDKELITWNQQQGKLFARYIIENNKNTKKKNIIKQSGIKKLHINCSFNNYEIQHDGHKKVLFLTKLYAKNFNKNHANFIFLGYPGTGKNHLASAIGNYLISQGKTIFIITISDLMSIIKETFNNIQSKYSENKIIHYLSKIDLLIFDEVGIQINSQYEKIIINQIIDKRYSNNKSTGILSNLNIYQIQKILGDRIIDRINCKNSLWLNFHWNSYRKNQNIS